MAVGLPGQSGDTVRDLAGQDYRHESGLAQTHHPAMAERNVLDLPNNIRTACFSGVQVKYPH